MQQSFWESNLLTSIVTLLVGSVAFLIYRKQQNDYKRDAASIILLEIKNAEYQLTQAKEIFIKDRIIPESILVMRTSSWHRYNYLFVRELSAEEWDLVNRFYEKCEQFDKTVQYNNSFFVKNEEQIRINLHQALAEYTKRYFDELDNVAENDAAARNELYQAINQHHSVLLESFYDTYIQEVAKAGSNYMYGPDKTINDYELIINTIRTDLSTSTVGIKFERIVRQNIRSRLFGWLAGGRAT